MFFLLRVAFWLTIVVLLIPTGGSQTNPPGPQVGAAEAVSVAGAAVSDMRGFCTRQAEACAVGSQVAVAFGHKLQATTKMLYEFLTEKFGPTTTGSVAGKTPPASGERESQNTLTPADILPTWRGPAPHRDAAKRPV